MQQAAEEEKEGIEEGADGVLAETDDEYIHDDDAYTTDKYALPRTFTHFINEISRYLMRLQYKVQ